MRSSYLLILFNLLERGLILFGPHAQLPDLFLVEVLLVALTLLIKGRVLDEGLREDLLGFVIVFLILQGEQIAAIFCGLVLLGLLLRLLAVLLLR